MKVITLVPVKNEAWVLRCTLKNFLKFSDEVIILDDSSTDETVNIVKQFPHTQIVSFTKQEEFVNMSVRRRQLLELGREAGGTHFVFLDADELLTANPSILRDEMSKMSPGDTLLLPWINVFNKDTGPVYDASQIENYKDFIFCDDSQAIFSNQTLSEARTPLSSGKRKILPFTTAHVLHLQHLAKVRNIYKQAWYRMQEHLEGKRAPIRINATYNYTKNVKADIPKPINDAWTLEHWQLINQESPATEYQKRINSLFLKHGVEFFEPLDIWHIPELRELFISNAGREPRPQAAPRWLLHLNLIKNKVKNSLHAKLS
jgi:hypothetical protein